MRRLGTHNGQADLELKRNIAEGTARVLGRVPDVDFEVVFGGKGTTTSCTLSCVQIASDIVPLL